MKYIVTLYQGGQQVNLVQCRRCMEVMTIALPEHSLDSFLDVAESLHKADCPKILARFDEAENGG